MRKSCMWLGGFCARLICLAVVLTFCTAPAYNAQAGGVSVSAKDPLTTQSIGPAASSTAYELRVGGMATNLENGGAVGEDTPGINIEFLFARYNTPQADPVTTFVLSPRLHLGTTIAPDGISEVYAGFTWEHHLATRVFLEASLGGAVHDGPNGDNSDSYGCPMLFRESASLGFDITHRVRLLATVDHVSNAGLCSENQGLTNAGVRLGYRW